MQHTLHVLTYTTRMQEHEEGKYEVKSSDGVSTYVVTICGIQCSHKTSCIPQCTASECQYLCRHMISCTCWDYQEGHLCKHCHKIKAMNNPAGSGNTQQDQSGAGDSSPLEFAFNPQSCIRDQAGKMSNFKCNFVQCACACITYTHIQLTYLFNRHQREENGSEGGT